MGIAITARDVVSNKLESKIISFIKSILSIPFLLNYYTKIESLKGQGLDIWKSFYGPDIPWTNWPPRLNSCVKPRKPAIEFDQQFRHHNTRFLKMADTSVTVDIPLLNQCRKILGWSHKSLAKKSGISPKTVYRMYRDGTIGRSSYSRVLHSVREEMEFLGYTPPHSLETNHKSEAEVSCGISHGVAIETTTQDVTIRIPGLSPDDVTPDMLAAIQQEIDAIVGRRMSPKKFDRGSLRITYEVTPAEAERLKWLIEAGELSKLGVAREIEIHRNCIEVGDAMHIDDIADLIGALEKIASMLLPREGRAQSIQTTDLVHEAVLSQIERGEVTWENREHFFASMRLKMRRILLDRG
ncbi:MAG: ECF-type sigma factor, partial [Planctomycetota bacterium]